MQKSGAIHFAAILFLVFEKRPHPCGCGLLLVLDAVGSCSRPCFCRKLSGSVNGIRHKRDVTSSLDRSGNCSLMLCAGPGDSSRKDLSSFGSILLQSCHILVADRFCFFAAESTNFSSSADGRAPSCRCSFSFGFVICHCITSFIACADAAAHVSTH